MRKFITVIAVILGLFATGCTATDSGGASPNTAGKSSKGAEEVDASGSAPAKPKPKPAETESQKNARESAENYLSFQSFSRSGLIEQLKFEGYPVKDATYGVDAQHADWKEQARLSAQNYLDLSSFSHSSMVQQLKYDGFTTEQAEYGATKAGL